MYLPSTSGPNLSLGLVQVVMHILSGAIYIGGDHAPYLTKFTSFQNRDCHFCVSPVLHVLVQVLVLVLVLVLAPVPFSSWPKALVLFMVSVLVFVMVLVRCSHGPSPSPGPGLLVSLPVVS